METDLHSRSWSMVCQKLNEKAGHKKTLSPTCLFKNVVASHLLDYDLKDDLHISIYSTLTHFNDVLSVYMDSKYKTQNWIFKNEKLESVQIVPRLHTTCQDSYEWDLNPC